MKHNGEKMNKKIVRIIHSLLLLLIVTTANAGTSRSGQELFPDTAKNRTLVKNAYDRYLNINSKHGRFINVNGIRMHYLEWGDKSGIPLIWSHGFGSTGFELVNVAEQLAEAGYHVYSITYRGHGQSQVTNYNFSLAHIADDIAAMMDKLGIKKAVIGGLSLGGGVTTTFYENYPDRVLALVLEDGGGHVIEPRTEAFHKKVLALHANLPAQKKLTFKDRFSGFQFAARLYMPSWNSTLPIGITPAFHSWVVPSKEGKFEMHFDPPKLLGAASNPAIPHYKLTLLGQSWRRIHPLITYRNLSVPMLIIDPTGDVFSPTEEFKVLQSMHAKLINLVEYPDTPHAAHPMRPEWFVRDMKNLLRRVKD
jgi:pimeloyl-ACP methyl ester carboxylesterase